ncbi:MAG TPA: hypothetical protein VGQ00_00540 [Candidatus Norongarragalinales archaeon]|jgi:small subunit ribosomal protein S27Ae|nr:hypothetical protein [Candidatus Norongarragalinales archaeon]
MADKKKSRETKNYKAHRSCPRDGPGFWLAEHANRFTCGRCGYTEMKQKA